MTGQIFRDFAARFSSKSKAAFDLTNKKHPEWEEFGFWEEHFDIRDV